MKTVYYLWKSLAFGQKQINNPMEWKVLPSFFFLFASRKDHLHVVLCSSASWEMELNIFVPLQPGGSCGAAWQTLPRWQVTEEKGPWDISVTLDDIRKRNQLGRSLVAFCDNSKLSLKRGEKNVQSSYEK